MEHFIRGVGAGEHVYDGKWGGVLVRGTLRQNLSHDAPYLGHYKPDTDDHFLGERMEEFECSCLREWDP